MKFVLIMLTTMFATFSPLAHGGDGAAPAEVSSDYNSSTLTLKPGKIEVKNAQLDAEADYTRDSAGRNGVSATLQASKKFLVSGDRSSYGEAAMVMLKPGIDARADVAITPKPTLQRLEAEATGVSVGHFQGIMRGDDLPDGNPGIPFLTSEFNLASASAIYRGINAGNITQVGARFAFLDGSFHVAGLVNNLGIDFCAHIVPIAVIAGISQGRDIKESAASVCAGVQLGKVGHLTNEISAVTDWKGYLKLADTTSLKEIAGLPIGIGYTYEKEWINGIPTDLNKVGAQVAF